MNRTLKLINIWDFEPATDLEFYLKHFFENRSILFPPSVSPSFFDGYVGYTVHRYKNFQVQLFISEPNRVVPDHVHPNVDSYEIAINGMTFMHSGVVIGTPETMMQGSGVYVDHTDWHGGYAGSNGGCFLSIQKWLNDIQPSSVEKDWAGEPVGELHAKQIIN